MNQKKTMKKVGVVANRQGERLWGAVLSVVVGDYESEGIYI